MALGSGRRKQANYSPQSLPGSLIQRRVRSHQVADHLPGGDVESALRWRSHGKRYRTLWAEADALRGRFLPGANSYGLSEHVDGHRFLAAFQFPIAAQAVEVLQNSFP